MSLYFSASNAMELPLRSIDVTGPQIITKNLCSDMPISENKLVVLTAKK